MKWWRLVFGATFWMNRCTGTGWRVLLSEIGILRPTLSRLRDGAELPTVMIGNIAKQYMPISSGPLVAGHRRRVSLNWTRSPPHKARRGSETNIYPFPAKVEGGQRPHQSGAFFTSLPTDSTSWPMPRTVLQALRVRAPATRAIRAILRTMSKSPSIITGPVWHSRLSPS